MTAKNNLITGIMRQFDYQKGGGFVNRKNIKFEVIVQQWLENSKLRVKESSYVKYSNLVRNHILPELGGIRVSQLTTETMEQFVRRKLNCGMKSGKGGLSEKTVKDILTVIKEICQYAAHWNVEIPCYFNLIKVRRSENEIRILDKKDQIRFAGFLTSDDSLTKTGILLSLYMGLRLGEVCALKKKNIIHKEEILQVRFTMQRIQDLELEQGRKTKIIVTEPKSSSSVRDIPIPMFLMRRLSVLKHASDEAYVLTGSSNKFIEPRSMENIFKRYLKECRMETINYHALRHTFATRCIEEGFDVKSLSEILGHANVNITLNRYVHSSMEQKRKNMNLLALG